jgi:hypothetical protein
LSINIVLCNPLLLCWLTADTSAGREEHHGSRRCVRRWIFVLGCWLVLALGPAASLRAELLINEILFNPPFGDTTNEYVELRGTPNLTIPDGTYLLSVEGDGGDNPGVVQNLFELSSRRLGQNGFLVLLQKNHHYKPNPLSAVITNSDTGDGWGSGSSSSLKHRGENGQTEIENASCTFFLIQTSVAPSIGDDIDVDNDGTPDGVYTNWVVLDSVGVLDGTGAGDIAYGQINFRWDKPPGAGASTAGNVVPIPFTPGYVGRNGNTADWAPTNWVASDNLLGRAPTWFLGRVSTLPGIGTNTCPTTRARAVLNHIGGPNFRAPVLPSVIVRESGTNTLVSESGLKDYYTIGLSTRATGAVTIRIDAELPVQISTNGGKTYGSQGIVTLASTTPRKILIRVPDDGAVGPSQQTALITHSVVATLDERYPTNTIVLPVTVTVVDTNVVLLSEAKVNPPGEDAPFEYVEIKGPPGKLVTNLWLLAVQGNASSDPGRADFVVNLTGQSFGSNGLLIVAAPGHPYLFSSNTTVLLAPQLTNSGGRLDNGSLSLLLVGTPQAIVEGTDLDNGNNGILEGLGSGAFIVDAIGWTDGASSDVVYGGVDLTQQSFTPDAASRLPGSNAPRSAVSWFVGDLMGSTGSSLVFEPVNRSTNAPVGSLLTPGVVNLKTPRFVPGVLTPVSGVIGDPDNEIVGFRVKAGADTSDNIFDPADALLNVTAISTNPAVVPDAGLVLTHVSRGDWTLAIQPVGVGYSQIILTVSDGAYSRNTFLDYAASEPGRPGGQWHTGISDASTAIPIDANWMFVGDDENQSLRIYSRTHSGGPVAAKDFSSFLGLVDFYEPDTPRAGEPKEVDIEASTRVGNRIYWLGSHSHSADLVERTNRARLFGTDVSGSGTNAQLKFIAHYDFLKLDLLAWDASNLHGKGADYYGLVASGATNVNPKAPDGSGFNIEGLCMAPGPNNTTNAYIAFRAPLIPPGSDPTNRTKALLLPVLNFGKLATQRLGPGSARFGPPIELNLGGRGVRSIEGVGGTNYLIIAGPPGAGDNLPPPGDFKLFTWTGTSTDQPQERGADVTGLNPEGIVEVPAGLWTSTNEFQIISDNGTNVYYGDGIQAKHLDLFGLPRAFKKFRVDTVALGDFVPSPPTIRLVSASADAVTIHWFSTAGSTYRVQRKSGFDAEWVDVAGDVLATDAVSSKSLPSASDANCFFRVITVP